MGVTATGSYCGLREEVDSTNAKLEHKGCKSSGTPEGELVSPPFSLEGASSAYLHFKTWWEIETQSPTAKDLLAVDYSINKGSTWLPAALLNPGKNPVEPVSEELPYSNMGLERAPEWTEDVVDLAPALGAHKEVEVRFRFDAVDDEHNGYRGWGVDNIEVNSNPPATPAITSCSIGASGTPVLEGSGFLLGSQVEQDAYGPETALAQSSTRVELGLSSLAMPSPPIPRPSR